MLLSFRGQVPFFVCSDLSLLTNQQRHKTLLSLLINWEKRAQNERGRAKWVFPIYLDDGPPTKCAMFQKSATIKHQQNQTCLRLKMRQSHAVINNICFPLLSVVSCCFQQLFAPFGEGCVCVCVAKASFPAYLLTFGKMCIFRPKRHNQFWSCFFSFCCPLLLPQDGTKCCFCLHKRQNIGRKRGLRHDVRLGSGPILPFGRLGSGQMFLLSSQFFTKLRG